MNLNYNPWKIKFSSSSSSSLTSVSSFAEFVPDCGSDVKWCLCVVGS